VRALGKHEEFGMVGKSTLVPDYVVSVLILQLGMVVRL
jgi:hypothetical protein